MWYKFYYHKTDFCNFPTLILVLLFVGPKIFSHDGKAYYMPWESTICISERWFYNTTGQKYKPVDELARLYRQCTKNDNILILNFPPARDGKIREKDIQVLNELRKQLQ